MPTPEDLIRDDYSGPGGWTEGLRRLGLTDVGLEWSRWACATRKAAGHLTVRADLGSYPTPPLLGRLYGYIASPPCQTFSSAGKGDGARVIGQLVEDIRAGNWTAHYDEKTRHVITVARNCDTLDPEWIALEQVPSALPIWEAIATRLRARGYSVWTGILCAADYGVPQTRRRAVLIASNTRSVHRPPATHEEIPSLFGLEPWVSMEQALGWIGHVDRRQNGAPIVTTDRPAPTLTASAGASGIWKLHLHEDGALVARRLALVEALVIQGFRPDYPVQGQNQGDRHEQIGNAIPPPLAAHIVATATGSDVPAPPHVRPYTQC